MAAAAYRSGEKLVNEWDGLTHDYTRKSGVVHTEIMLPAHAPPAFADRSTLWNSVEEIEKSSTAQLAREIEVALPVELSRAEQLALVRSFVKDNFVSAGKIIMKIPPTGTGERTPRSGGRHGQLTPTGRWRPQAGRSASTTAAISARALIKSPASTWGLPPVRWSERASRR